MNNKHWSHIEAWEKHSKEMEKQFMKISDTKPKTKTYWVNVYSHNKTNEILMGCSVFASEQEAKEVGIDAVDMSDHDYIKTISFELDENES